MPIKLSCPNCGKELNAPDTLIGKLAACPRCSTQFPVQATSQPSASSTSFQLNVSGLDPPRADSPATPPVATQPPPPVPQSPPSHATPASPHDTAAMAIPLPTQPSGSSPPPIFPAARQSTTNGAPPAPPSAFRTAQPIQQPANTNAVPIAPNTATPINNHAGAAQPSASQLGSPAGRVAKSARFVSGGATTTRINLGKDGQLPELVVEEGKKTEPQHENKQSTKPLLLVIALFVSVALSVLMLFVEPEAKATRSIRKAIAREQLEKFYIGDEPTQEYQRLLREALAASRQGDERTARRRYRQVLDMIHAEDKTDSIGLTGPKLAASPPTDADLELQLSILLSNE